MRSTTLSPHINCFSKIVAPHHLELPQHLSEEERTRANTLLDIAKRIIDEPGSSDQFLTPEQIAELGKNNKEYNSQFTLQEDVFFTAIRQDNNFYRTRILNRAYNHIVSSPGMLTEENVNKTISSEVQFDMARAKRTDGSFVNKLGRLIEPSSLALTVVAAIKDEFQQVAFK